MKLEIKGKLIKVTDEIVKGNFNYKIAVIQTSDEACYPFQFVKDGVKKLDYVNQGDSVEVTGYLNGREYNGTWFTSLTGTFIKKDSAEVAPAVIEDVPF